MPIDPNTVGAAGLVAILVPQVAKLIGQLLGQSSATSAAKLDDRQKLMAELTAANESLRTSLESKTKEGLHFFYVATRVLSAVERCAGDLADCRDALQTGSSAGLAEKISAVEQGLMVQVEILKSVIRESGGFNESQT